MTTESAHWTLPEIVKQLESCRFVCGGGALENNEAFQVLKEAAKASPFILIQDHDAHWYVIEQRYQAEFRRWVEYMESDSDENYVGQSFDSCALSGSPTNVSFPWFTES